MPTSLQADLMILLVSMALGALLGLEREWRKKPAGLRTHTFVAGASASLIILGKTIIQEFSDNNTAIQSDPLRLLQAVMVGVSFIGAGAIIKGDGQMPKNLSNAASILFTAIIGSAVALHHYILAASMTLIGLFLNGVIGSLEQKLPKRDEGG